MYFNGSAISKTGSAAKWLVLKRSLQIILLALLCLNAGSEELYALKFLGKDNDGTRYYQCSNSCGKIKVIRTANAVYRIFSIPFSGEVKAKSFQEAAEKACQSDQKPLEKATNPSPARELPSC